MPGTFFVDCGLWIMWTSILQDVGGEERPLADSLLVLLDFLVPNEPELQHLTGMATATEQQVRPPDKVVDL
jgi:sugar/nucleoside kinase (ribokinase family)